MAGKKVAARALKELIARIEETFHDVTSSIGSGVDGSPEDLRELQRSLVLMSRDASVAACDLYSNIRLAESTETLRRG